MIANGCKEQVVGRKAQRDGTYKREYEISKDQKSKTIETNKHKNNVAIEKSPCLHGFENGTNGQLNKQLAKGGMIRRLTPLECERLQTVADNYTNHVSDSQRYKMLGNGWTVDVISHIFSHLKTK